MNEEYYKLALIIVNKLNNLVVNNKQVLFIEDACLPHELNGEWKISHCILDKPNTRMSSQKLIKWAENLLGNFGYAI